MKTSDPEQDYGHILKYTGIFGGVQGINILIGLVRNKIVAMLLGPQGMGLTSLFNSTVSFLSQATNMGIAFSAVRHVADYYEQGDEERLRHFVQVIRGWSLLTALLGMLVCILAGSLFDKLTFSWGNHTLHFIFLAPAVGLLAITGGETAILKGCRRLKALALIQMYNVILSLLISVPVYYFFRSSGIVPVIVLMALSSMVLTVSYSFRLYPPVLRGSLGILGEGMEMVRLGVAFVLAGIIGSGAEILIRSFLNIEGSLDDVGFYNAGFMITITYASMVFSAMETDYFPRLTAASHQWRSMVDTVNRQLEVSLLLVAPLLAFLIVFMPIVIPLLYTAEFRPVVAMAQVAVLSMYLKAVTLPMAYLQLAKGDSLGYLLLEAAYYVFLIVVIVLGYRYFGLLGTGIALTIAHLFDFVSVYLYIFLRYRYRMSLAVVRQMMIQIPLGCAVYVATLSASPWVSYGLGSLLALISLWISFHVIRSKTGLWKALKSKMLSKTGHNGTSSREENV